MAFFLHSSFLKLGEKKINLRGCMNGGRGKTCEERDVLAGSAKVSGSQLTLMLILVEERSVEHLLEVVSHVETGVVCPVAAISLVLEEFSFPAH